MRATNDILDAIAKMASEGRATGTGIDTRPIELTIDETPFRKEFRRYCVKQLWTCYHTHDSRKSDTGFPDEVCARGHRVVFAELKREDGIVSADQLTWGEILSAVGGNVEYYLWRPSDWPKILEVMK